MPNLTVASQSGLPYDLYAGCEARFVILVGNLNEPSMTEMLGFLDEAASEVSNVGTIAFIGYDGGGAVADQTDAAGAASDYGVDVVVYDPSLSTFNAWSEFSPPRLYVVDTEAVVSWVNAGPTAQSQLEGKLEDLD